MIDESLKNKIAMMCACSVLIVALIFGSLYAIQFGLQRYQDYLVEKAMQRIPESAFQREFSRGYVRWMLKYCIANSERRKFSTDERLNYCACYMEEKTRRLTMAEQSIGVDKNWNSYAMPPDIQNKLNEIDSACLNRALRN